MRTRVLTRTGLALMGALVSSLALSSTSAFAAPPEAPVTKPATAIAGTSATLNGELNPKAGAPEALEYDFTYKQSATECAEEFFAPATPVSAEGKPKEAVSVPVTGLQPSKPYSFCVVAKRGAEPSATGLPLTFTTLGMAPKVDEESTSNVTPFEAGLEARVNPNNQPTTDSFEYSTKATGETLEGTITSLPGENSTLEGFGDGTAFVTAHTLTSGTTYFYRVVATNATNTTKGKVEQFTTKTAEAPIVASESVSGLTATDAKLEAKVNPNYQETGYHFEYATKATGETLEGTITAVEGAPPAPLLTAVFGEQLAGPVDLGNGLQTGVTYFYRVVAKNAAGERKGPVQSFTTLAVPAVTTAGASSVTRTSAMLSGSVNPAGGPTTYHFAYIEQAAYVAAKAEGAPNPYLHGRTTPESSSVGSDYVPHAVGPTFVSELKPGVAYHYAVVASNSVGTTIDPTGATFTTSAPTLPTVVTGASVEITPTTAVVLGTLDTRGLPTSYQFELGTEAGHYFPQTSVAAGSAPGAQPVSLQLSYLAPGATYHYQLCATNQDGRECGADGTFATPGVLSSLSFPATPSLLPTSVGASAGTEGAKGPTTKGLTNAQKLAKALKACRKKPKHRRASCERQARKRYSTTKRAAKGKGK